MYNCNAKIEKPQISLRNNLISFITYWYKIEKEPHSIDGSSISAILFIFSYNKCLRSSSADSGCKYAGAISNTVLHPLIPSFAIR